MNTPRLRPPLLIGAASVVLGVATTSAMALAMSGGPAPAAPAPACSPPALPGAVVDVTLTDMGGMMGPGTSGSPMMGPGMMGPGMMGPGMGMMRLSANPRSVPAGPVSLRAFNRGSLSHEVVVLPLTAGQSVGQRPVGADGKIDETGSLGEAAQTCGSGDGDGVAPGSASWVTVNLSAGRYELVCDRAGHYSSGMYTELDVT